MLFRVAEREKNEYIAHGVILMCGIAGWYDRNLDLRQASDILSEMSETLKRRGPDEGGIVCGRTYAMIHRRLAVIDVENGKQPMTKNIGGKSYTIVYNGELYNTYELRRELQECGYEFSTKSDTEVVLTAYLKWGEYCVYRMNGIFAFGVWCKEKESLFIARDRIGVKPLFYYLYESGIIFASEIKTLLKNPLIPPHIDEEGLSELLLIGPGRTPGQGVYRGISELLPGEYAKYDEKGFYRRKYFTLEAHEITKDLDENIRNIRELLIDSIERQLVSDVPLCCFLSGGLDSSIISYAASEHHKRNGSLPVDTYSVDYTDNNKYFKKSLFQPTPDSEFIEIMVDAIGSRHHSVTIDNYDLFSALTEAADARDFPGMADVDSSLLLFCREIKKDFTVGVSGECADELFGGYPWYHNREILFDDNFPWSRSLDIRRSILKKGFLPKGDEYVRQRYLDTCKNTDRLKNDSKLEARMREMFALNFYWFMQTLLENNVTKENIVYI